MVYDLHGYGYHRASAPSAPLPIPWTQNHQYHPIHPQHHSVCHFPDRVPLPTIPTSSTYNARVRIEGRGTGWTDVSSGFVPYYSSDVFCDYGPSVGTFLGSCRICLLVDRRRSITSGIILELLYLVFSVSEEG